MLQPDAAELFILEGSNSYVLPPAVAFCTDKITMHYGFESDWNASDKPVDGYRYYIRQIISSDGRPRPVHRSHAIRGELELLTFTRQNIINNLDTAQPLPAGVTHRPRVISFPFLTFIDGFGLYRNMYRSLMGFYIIPAGLSYTDRNRRTNVFPITLGPHGSNLADVVKAIGPRMY